MNETQQLDDDRPWTKHVQLPDFVVLRMIARQLDSQITDDYDVVDLIKRNNEPDKWVVLLALKLPSP